MASTQQSPELRPEAPSDGVFATGTADDIVKHVCENFTSPSDDLWVIRMNGMLTVVVEAMVWLRDEGMIDIDAHEIREFIPLQRVMELADRDKFPDMPEEIRGNIERYLDTVPAFDGSVPAKAQDEATWAHHGFMNMQLAKILET